MSTLAAVETAGKAPANARARKGVYEPYNEFHQCWYPVLLSEDIKVGEAKSVKFCDARIAVFRGSDGAVRAVSARCRHMGADVGLGTVVGNHIQCPYHHWEYDQRGACVRIPSGDKVPSGTALFSFPCEEKWGFVWVFLGKEPTYGIPVVPNCEAGRVLSRSFKLVLDQPLRVEPWVFGTNVFDFAHFKAVHNWKMIDCTTFSDKNRMGWEGKIEGMGAARLEMYGVATVVSYMKRDGEAPKRHIAALTPQGDDGLGMYFTVFADLENDSEQAHKDASRCLDELERLHRLLPKEDLHILNSIEFGKIRLTEVDRELAQFLGYVNKYPRTTVRELEAGEQSQ